MIKKETFLGGDGERQPVFQKFADGQVVRTILEGQRATIIVRPNGMILVRKSLDLDQNPTDYGDIYLFKTGSEERILEIVRPAPIAQFFTIVPPIEEMTGRRGQPIIGTAQGQAIDLALALELGMEDPKMIDANKGSKIDPSVVAFVERSLAA